MPIIESGLPSEALLAQIAVSKYADGLPLFRQEGIYARDDTPFGGSGPPMVAYLFEDSRSGDCVQRHLGGYRRILQVPSRQIAARSPAG